MREEGLCVWNCANEVALGIKNENFAILPEYEQEASQSGDTALWNVLFYVDSFV